MQTLTSRDICERLFNKIGTFVSSAFDHAPNEFKALYRNKVQDFPGGFRRIEMVPRMLMIKRIAKDCAADPEVAVLILRNWFRSQPALHDSAVGFLRTLGYQISEPDFDNDSIIYQSLSPEHIQSEESAYYFSPGSSMSEVDRLEMTVMVALLGWFPDPSGSGENAD